MPSKWKLEFERRCATCPGVSAIGGGPMTALLTMPPAALTQLSKNNGGAFPFWRVCRHESAHQSVGAGAMS